MRWTTATFTTILGLLCACPSEPAAGSTDGSSTGGSTGAPACTPGTESCVCAAGGCDGGLACLSNICVVLPAGESSTGAAESSSSSSSSAGEASTDASTSSTGVADGTTSERTSSESESGASTTEAVPCLEGNNTCADGVLQQCTDGVAIETSCVDACAPSGYDSPGCLDANACECAGFIDEYCIDAITTYCNCQLLVQGYICDEDLEVSVYETCVDPESNNHEWLLCVLSYAPTDEATCNAAFNVCPF